MLENNSTAKELVSILPISLFVIAFAVASPVTFATSAANCTPTNCNMHNVTIDIGSLGANPCNGQPASADAWVTGNFQMHGSADGTHVTGTLEGKITITQDNGVVFTGHVQDWFGGNINKGGAAETSGTANFNLDGSDGSSYHINTNSHTTVTPDGVVTVNFSNLNCH